MDSDCVIADSSSFIACHLEIYEHANTWWIQIAGNLAGPFDTTDDALDFIPAFLRSID